MDKKYILLIISLSIIGLIGFSIYNNNSNILIENTIQQSNAIFLDIVPKTLANGDNPIAILNNSAFGLFGFSGAGTELSPYIIEDLAITNTSNNIEIRNTDAYFIIRNCTLDGVNQSSYGLYLNNVTNGIFEGNIFRNCFQGTYSYLSNYNKYNSNNFLNNSFDGLYLDQSDYSTVFNNTFNGFLNGDIGLRLDDSDHHYISHNEYHNLTEAGIWLDTTTNITMIDNDFYTNERGVYFISTNNNCSVSQGYFDGNTYGFEIADSSDITIENNLMDGNNYGILFSNTNYLTIKNNNFTYGNSYNIRGNYLTSFSRNTTIDNNRLQNIGVRLTGCIDGTFTNNIVESVPGDLRLFSCGNMNVTGNIFNSSNSGIELDTQTNNTIVKWNTFLQHTTHATDDGGSNVFMYNFYDDHTTPDNNGDGYVDNPYTIAGTATNVDLFPLAASNNIDNDLDGLTNFQEIVLGTDPDDPDTDDDLLDDWWEVNWGTNPLVNDTAEDPDSDGLTNLDEYNYGTDPLDEDTDDDTFSDGDEVDAGTDPLDPNSFPSAIYDPKAILEDPISIVILATSGLTTAAVAAGLAIRSFANRITNKLTQFTQSFAEWELVKDALSGQISEIASTISRKRDYLEECPVCDAAKIGPYCYVCGTTLSYEEAELVKKKDSEKK